MNTKRMTGLVALAGLAMMLSPYSPRPAEAGTLYGVAYATAAGSSVDPFPSGRQLVTLDPATGQVTQVVGPLGYEVEGLAFNPVTGVLYGTGLGPGAASGPEPGYLMQINTTSGAGTLIGSHGYGIGNGSTVAETGPYMFSDLAFRSDGTLFGMDIYRNRPIEINLATGEALANGLGPAMGAEAGLAADALDTFFAGPTASDSPLTDLITMDPVSGSSSNAVDLTGYGAYFGRSEGVGVGSGPGPGPIFVSGFEALDFDDNGALLGVAFFGGDNPPVGSYLSTINPTTGQMTVLGQTHYGNETVYVDAIAFIPEPLSVVLLAGGLTLWLIQWRVRRRA
jgi:hypothetical protein